MQCQPLSPCRWATLTALSWHLGWSLAPPSPPMSFNQSTAMLVSDADLTPGRKPQQRPGERAAYAYSHHLPPSLVGAAAAGDEQIEGHANSQEQLLAEVPLIEVQQRAAIMFAGVSGAVVPSGRSEAASAPSFGLAKAVKAVIDALPDKLFDRHAEHRPCGLLCRYGAAGMLLCDLHGLPLVPWVMAEPIGKAAAKQVEKISELKKTARKKAKRRGADAEAAANAVLRRRVALSLPTTDEVKAAVRRLARAARPEPPAAPEAPLAEPAEPPLPPAPTPPPPEPLSPEVQAQIDMAMSPEAAAVIKPAYIIARRTHPSRLARVASLDDDEELELAQVRFKHALRRLAAAFPEEYSKEYCRWDEHSAREVVHWTVRVHCTGHRIRAAEIAAAVARFDLQKAADDRLAEMHRRAAPDARGEGA